MSYETDFDTAFTILLGKARGTITPTGTPPATGGGTTQTYRSFSVPFEWTGGGEPVTQGGADPLLVELPDAARLVWAHLFAGDGTGAGQTTNAIIELRVTNQSNFGTSTPAYGTGSKPSLNGQSSVNMDLSGWLLDYDAGDALIAYVTAFTGSATWLTLSLQFQVAALITDLANVVNAAADLLVNADGSTLTFRT